MIYKGVERSSPHARQKTAEIAVRCGKQRIKTCLALFSFFRCSIDSIIPNVRDLYLKRCVTEAQHIGTFYI